MKAITLLISSLLLAACAAGYAPRYHYNNIEVANLSGGAVSNVKVQIGERELSCASVAKNALCNERFGKRPYPQQPIQLSWTDGDGRRQLQQTDPIVPLMLTPALALRVMLDIQQDGSVKA